MKSISVVTCSKDRNEYLINNFLSTAKIKNLKEHIHIDFSSNLGLSNEYEVNEKLKIVRIENEKQWWLTRAFNAALHFASGEYILRINADTELNFEEFNQLNLDDINYINFCIDKYDYGNILCESGLLKKINGYNEFLFGWGYDDYDLHQRIISTKDVKYKIVDGRNYIKINEHDNYKRVSNDTNVSKKWVDAHLLANHKKNRFISKKIYWNNDYELIYNNSGKNYTIDHKYKISKFYFFKHIQAKAEFMSTFLNEYYKKQVFNKIKLFFYLVPYKIFEQIFKVKIAP